MRCGVLFFLVIFGLCIGLLGLLIARTLLRNRKKRAILKKVRDQYLNSSDFNGLSVASLIDTYTPKFLANILKELIREGTSAVLFPDQQINAFIKRLPEEPVDVQLRKIDSQLEFGVIYPSASLLKSVVDASNYQGKPFTLRLALGEPQLAFQAFDLSVLEFYRNDPRYHYDHDDIAGSIGITTEYFQSEEMAEHDQILLESFGFCFDSDLNRCVAVFLRYLSKLSPQHQQIWHAKQLDIDCSLHPDFYRSAIVGDWYQGISIFDAFIEELRELNEICKLIGRPPLFRNEYSENMKPRGFGFLIRPTLKEYNEFVHLLDKMLSDNINIAFFRNDIELEREEVRKDKKVVITRKGSIQLLEEWLAKYFKTPQQELMTEALNTLKKIRKLRQSPAHAVNEDVFDKQFQKDQRELIKDAYNAVSIIRQAFAFHPSARGYKVPEWLDTGTIWTQ